MIKFDYTQLSVRTVMLKRATTAIGGSITHEVVDADGNVSEKREVVPFAVVREFIKRCDDVRNYLDPVEVAVVHYQDMIVCLERRDVMRDLIDSEDGEVSVWNPMTERVLKALVNKLETMDREWYIDGRYMYAFEHNDVAKSVSDANNLLKSGEFKSVTVDSIDLSKMYDNKQMVLSPRTCIAYTDVSTGELGISPPIWRSATFTSENQNVMISDESDDERVTKDEQSNTGNILSQFESIDERVFVNLSFALRGGQIISKIFGFDSIDVLRLPHMMVDLQTINLPALPRESQMTYDIGTPFTHALAWTIGAYHRIECMNDALELRALIKYLTTRGIYQRSSIMEQNIYIDSEMKHVGRVDISDLLLTNNTDEQEMLQSA